MNFEKEKLHTPVCNESEDFELDSEAIQTMTSFFELLIDADKKSKKRRKKW